MAADVAPSRAACNPTDPSATCLTFNPLTPSSVLDRGGFTGDFSPPPGALNAYSQVRLQFRFTGAWTTPFTLDQLSVKGDGIISSLSIPSKIINFATNDFDDNNSAWATLNTNINQLNFANSLLSLRIPDGVAPDGATLEARIQYRSVNQAQLNSSGSNFFTAADIPTPPPSDVPGPLPILGAGIGLAYSRRLRGRIRSSV
ncbi:MAG: hypothetical protein ACKOZW_10810 [Cyanobium sp.]